MMFFKKVKGYNMEKLSIKRDQELEIVVRIVEKDTSAATSIVAVFRFSETDGTIGGLNYDKRGLGRIKRLLHKSKVAVLNQMSKINNEGKN